MYSGSMERASLFAVNDDANSAKNRNEKKGSTPPYTLKRRLDKGSFF
jgi:hypothetical protein